MGSTVQLSEGASPQNHRRPGFGSLLFRAGGAHATDRG